MIGVSLAAERIWSLTERGSRATSGARHLDDRVDQAPCLTLVTNLKCLCRAAAASHPRHASHVGSLIATDHMCRHTT